MARQRNKRTTAGNTETVSGTTTETPSATDLTNTSNETRRGNMALSQDKINALMSKSRSRGSGQSVIKNFIDSGEAGIEVSLTDGSFKGKTAKQVQATLNNAKKASNVNGLVFPNHASIRVYVESAKDSDDGAEHVYLVNDAVEG